MLSPDKEKSNIREAAGKRMSTASFYQFQSHKCTTGAHGCLSLLCARSLFNHHFLSRSIAHANDVQTSLRLGFAFTIDGVTVHRINVVICFQGKHTRRFWVVIG